jgi:cytoskeletal protein CcmA (bactofilin family)
MITLAKEAVMPNPNRFLPALLLGGLFAACTTLASAQTFGESVTQRGPVLEDLYIAGSNVTVAAEAEGDVSAAGGHVTIENSVNNDVMAIGGTVTLRARVKDDARLAGGEVSVSGEVGDELLALGGTVNVAPEARIGGRAWLAGGTLEIAGRVAKGLKAAGGTIIIAGEILGDADVVGEHIEIRPGAIIHGHLHYRSPNDAKIAPEARVLGAVIKTPFEAREPGPRARHAGGFIFSLLGLFVTATVLLLLFPRFAPRAARGVHEAPWVALGLGLAVLAGGPLVVLLLLVSLIGIWLGLMVLVLYLILLLLGYLSGVLFLADTGVRRIRHEEQPGRGWTIAAIAATLVVLGLLRLIPVLGGLVSFAVLLFGLGALTRALWERYNIADAGAKLSTPKKGRRRQS